MRKITLLTIFSFLGHLLMAQCLNISIENQQVIQGSLQFDIYLQKNANTTDNIHLGTSDLVLNFDTNYFSNPQFQKEETTVAASCVLATDHLIINLDAPAVSDEASLNANTLLVDEQGVILGRFRLFGFQETDACLASLSWKTEGNGLKTKLHQVINAPRFPSTAIAICEAKIATCEVETSVELIVAESKPTPNFSLQPNPAIDFVLVNGNNLSEYHWTLYNSLGQKKVMTFKQLNEEQLILDLKGLPAGIYVVEMRDEGRFIVKKFVKI